MMRTAVEYYGHHIPGMIPRIIVAQSFLRALADPDEGSDEPGLWSCHVIARLCQKKFFNEWQVVDGMFDKGYKHSWLSYKELILDTYPVASQGTMLLVDGTSVLAPWSRFYQPHKYHDEVIEDWNNEFNNLWESLHG